MLTTESISHCDPKRRFDALNNATEELKKQYDGLCDVYDQESLLQTYLIASLSNENALFNASFHCSLMIEKLAAIRVRRMELVQYNFHSSKRCTESFYVSLVSYVTLNRCQKLLYYGKCATLSSDVSKGISSVYIFHASFSTFCYKDVCKCRQNPFGKRMERTRNDQAGGNTK